MKKRCTATNRQGQRCKLPPEPGFNVCRFHGARGGAPKGNKNALKTGEYETIWLDQLEDEEKELVSQIDLDAVGQLNEQILLAVIRINRMLARYKALKAEKMVLVARKEGEEGKGRVEVEEYRHVEDMLSRLDDAINRTQETLSKLIEKRHRIETTVTEADTSTLDSLVKAIGLSIQAVKGDE